MNSDSMEKEPLLAIIVLNWNRWHDTVKCLESIYQSAYTNYFVILVDNGSTDGSVEKIKKWADGGIEIESAFFKYSPGNKPIRMVIVSEKKAAAEWSVNLEAAGAQLILVRNKKNHGFAKGNNIAITYAVESCNVKYVILLNNDIVLQAQCLRELVTSAEKDEGIGSCQPKMLLMDTPELIDAAGISVRNVHGGAVPVGHGLPDNAPFCSPQEIFGVCAGAALYRKRMLDQVGLFDEAFFAYYEDVDLALRSSMAGWRAHYAPDAIAYHGHSATLGKESPLKTYLLERNRYYYFIKNVPRDILLLFLKNRAGVFFKTFLCFLKTGRLRHLAAFLIGNIAGIAHFPQMFFKRWKLRSSQHVSDDAVRKWFLP